MERAEKIIAAATKASENYIAAFMPKGHSEEFDRAIKLSYETGVLRAEVRTLCHELKDFDAPSTSDQETTYDTQAGQYVIHFDFTPGEPQTRDDPGCDPEIYINAVYANGMNVHYDLSESLLDRMAEHCLIDVHEKIADAKTDAAISRYEARMDV